MAKDKVSIKVKVENIEELVREVVAMQHDGYFVSSKDIPTHTEEMGIWVPFRYKRKHKRALLLVKQGAEAKPEESGYLDSFEADKQLIGVLQNIGIHWNWQDGEGKPLAQPDDDPSVWEEISDPELMFIVAHLEDATTILPQRSTA